MNRRQARRYRRALRRLMRRAVTSRAGTFTTPHGVHIIHKIPKAT